MLAVEYPHKSGHLATGPEDVDVTPARLFPAFHGALDWHSSLHMQWSLTQLLPSLAGDLAARVTEVLDARLTAANIAREVAYLEAHPGFERPYGWAWASVLAAECGPRWTAAVAPLASSVGDAMIAWLPRLAYPVRHGVHSNTAFALLLMHEAYSALGRRETVAAIEEAAVRFFGDDRACDLRWEPSGADFLSPALCEAALMQRVLGPSFGAWLAAFLPALDDPACPLDDVPLVLDRTDGQAVHLVGLALSRAWQLRLLGRRLAAARRLVAAALPEITGGDFMATHWLVSFALLAQRAVA